MCIIIESDVYHCWVCDLKGRGLAKLIKKVDASKVAEYLSDYRSFKKTENKSEQDEIRIDLPEDFRLLINPKSSDPDWKAVTKYALSRGFTKKTMWSFRIGYSRSFQWRRRLMIPSFDKDGNINYITGRAIDPDNSFRYKNESAPRKTIIFNEMDIDFSKPLLLAEGPMDLVKVKMNKTCLLGSTLGSDNLLFQRIVENQTPIILILDSDAQSKALKIANLLYQYSIPVSINFPSPGNDLNDMDILSIEQLIATAQQYNYNTKIKLKLGSCKL
jgi:hypothetical protein